MFLHPVRPVALRAYRVNPGKMAHEEKETSMKHVLKLAVLLAFICSPLIASKNSQTFLLPTDVRVGDTTLPKGHCEVVWTEKSGSQVQLTIKTEDKKTINVSAKVIEEKHDNVAVATDVFNGVRYLTEFQTRSARFVIEGVPTDKK